MRKVLYFLALFGYLNVLCYEVKYCTLLTESIPVAASDTLLEVVLEDVLHLEHNHDKEEFPEFMYDDYRILASFLGVLPVILFVFWLLRKLYLLNETIKHPVYCLRRLILPGYYTFLYRYRLF